MVLLININTQVTKLVDQLFQVFRFYLAQIKQNAFFRGSQRSPDGALAEESDQLVSLRRAAIAWALER